MDSKKIRHRFFTSKLLKNNYLYISNINLCLSTKGRKTIKFNKPAEGHGPSRAVKGRRQRKVRTMATRRKGESVTHERTHLSFTKLWPNTHDQRMDLLLSFLPISFFHPLLSINPKPNLYELLQINCFMWTVPYVSSVAFLLSLHPSHHYYFLFFLLTHS